MGGGWNPFRRSSSDEPVVIYSTPTPVQEQQTTEKKSTKKRKPNTVLTNMEGDLGSTNSLHKTLGGA